MLFIILIVAFFAFQYFAFPLLACMRNACLVAVAFFALFVGQPLYRMQVFGEKPGTAIANSKVVPVGAQFFPYMNLSNIIFNQPGKGTWAGPCVHYSHYQQKLMNLFGVPSTLMTGYGHCALKFEEDSRSYMTDNGYWYKKIVEVGQGNWSPEGPETLYVVPGDPNPLTPFLFPGVLLAFVLISFPLETVLSGSNQARSPFRSKGIIRSIPGKNELRYRRSGGRIYVEREGVEVSLDPAEVRQLEDAPDMFFHEVLGHFQIVAG